VFGEARRESGAMLQMCRHLGFSPRADPDDSALVRVSKRLGDGAE
jgi:hypothetical protein